MVFRMDRRIVFRASHFGGDDLGFEFNEYASPKITICPAALRPEERSFTTLRRRLVID